MGDRIGLRDSLPVMITRGVSKLITDSGVIRYKIIAEEWRVFDKTNPQRWEFPQGIFIQRYDDKFKVNMHITADSAWFYDQKVWKLRGHIVMNDNEAQSHLTTEELYWNMQTGELSSNVYTRLTEPQQAIEGNWFRAVVQNGRPTRYHIKQTRGFMPMNDMAAKPQVQSTDTAARSANDSIAQPDLQREAPVSKPKSKPHGS